MPESAGSAASNCSNASSPPADAPTPTIEVGRFWGRGDGCDVALVRDRGRNFICQPLADLDHVLIAINGALIASSGLVFLDAERLPVYARAKGGRPTDSTFDPSRKAVNPVYIFR